ncbi:MAG: hypothetical protein AABX72_01575, partial [Nanoarchaeota archaeon]
NNQWKQIDENFGTQNCRSGYAYCVDNNLYQFHVKNTFSEPLVIYGDTNLSFTLASLANVPLLSSSAIVEGNTVTYSNIIPGIDVRYTYLPHKVKEDIIIKDRTALASLTNDLNLDFTIDTYGSPSLANTDRIKMGDLYIADLIAYDAVGTSINIPFSMTGNTLRLTLPLSWLTNETREYPVIIDPTIQTNLSANEDLFITYDPNIPPSGTMGRTDSPTRIDVGYYDEATPPEIGFENYNRGYMLWDISNIPDTATILNLNMTLRAGQAGNTTNHEITITHMDGNHTTYPDNTSVNPCIGNCQFFTDIGNGTNYTTTSYRTTGKHYFNLSNATSDFTNALSKDTFGVGLWVKGDTDHSDLFERATELRIYSPSEASNPNFRPVLYVTYSIAGANETDGDSAITQGILNATSTAVIHTEQQVYTRSVSGTQQLGRFDRVAVFNNQRWAFNYITAGESFTNMNNITTNFYVLELTDLFPSDITAQVSTFINATKQ